MGTLVPNTTYVYERVDNRIYARPFGVSERKLVGFYSSQVGKQLQDRLLTDWNDLMIEAEKNETLRDALEEAVTIYNLIKQHKNG